MKATKEDRRVVGLGGFFFRSADPAALSKWYSEHLGIRIQDNVALFSWKSVRGRSRRGQTVWSLFPKGSDYFPADKQFMVNYRVRNLKKVLAALKKEGVRVAPKVEESKYGKFGWAFDPEGNRIELWEPPRGNAAPESEIPME